MLTNHAKDDLGSAVGVVFDSLSPLQNPRIRLVWEERKGQNGSLVYWKCPGGMIEEKDMNPQHPYDDARTAEAAFRREVFEETGVVLEQVIALGIEKKFGRGKVPHSKYLFVGFGDFSTATKKKGDEGEIIGTFTFNEVTKSDIFFPRHRNLLEMAYAKVKEMLG